MSVYTGAMVAGVKFGALALGMETAETVATFNHAFASRSGKLASARVQSAATKNIAAVEQDKITSNIQVQLNQAQAEAAAKVSAAQAGSTGGSVSAVIQQTEANKSYAIAANNSRAEQSKETLRTEIFNASMGIQSNVQRPQSTKLGAVMNAVSTVTGGDLAIAEAFFNAPDTPVGTAAPDAGTLSIGVD